MDATIAALLAWLERPAFLSATHPVPPVTRRRIRARVGFSLSGSHQSTTLMGWWRWVFS